MASLIISGWSRALNSSGDRMATCFPPRAKPITISRSGSSASRRNKFRVAVANSGCRGGALRMPSEPLLPKRRIHVSVW